MTREEIVEQVSKKLGIKRGLGGWWYVWDKADKLWDALIDASSENEELKAKLADAEVRLAERERAQDAEIGRWQQAIYEKCKEVVGADGDYIIDGGGEDSGDPLDFTLCEIGQAFAWLKDKPADSERVKELREALYQSIVELEYVQCVENCSSGLCASSRGKELVNSGMKLLGIKDLSGETLAGARAVLSEEGK